MQAKVTQLRLEMAYSWWKWRLRTKKGLFLAMSYALGGTCLILSYLLDVMWLLMPLI